MSVRATVSWLAPESFASRVHSARSDGPQISRLQGRRIQEKEEKGKVRKRKEKESGRQNGKEIGRENQRGKDQIGEVKEVRREKANRQAKVPKKTK